MTCKKITIFFGMLFLVFCVSFVSSPSTFAVDPIHLHVTSDNNSSVNLCGYSGTPSCSDYHFLYIVSSDRANLNSNIYVNITLQYSNRQIYFFNTDFVLINTDSSVVAFNNANYYFSYVSNPDAYLDIYLYPDNPFEPTISGTLSVTENGTFDVSTYQYVDVDVPAEVIQGDYHDDLLSINKSILTCGAVCLVIYFFYCIYRMIIKSAGGWGS